MSKYQKVQSDHWSLGQFYETDDTEKMEYTEYNTDNLNYSDTVTNYTISTKDINEWMLLSHAFILVQGQLNKAGTGDPYAATDNVALVNNGYNVFRRAEINFNGTLVEEVQEVGVTTQVKGLLQFSDDYKRSVGSNMLWYPDTNTGAADKSKYVLSDGDTGANVGVALGATRQLAGDNATYNMGFAQRNALNITAAAEKLTSLFLPLRHLFGLCSIDKAIRGQRVTIKLERSAMDDMIFRANGVDAGKFSISKISLWVPLLKPSLEMAVQLEKVFGQNQTIPYTFHQYNTLKSEANTEVNRTYRIITQSERPVHCFIVPQLAAKVGDQEQNNMIFDHSNITNMHLRVNGIQYPSEEYRSDFATAGAEDYARVYMSLMQYRNNVMNEDTGSLINYEDFKNLYPIFSFDLSHLPENIYKSSVDLEMRCKMSAAPGSALAFYAIVVSEKHYSLTNLGQRTQITVQ